MRVYTSKAFSSHVFLYFALALVGEALYMHRYVCVCVCVRACVRACVRVCVRACVRACVHAWPHVRRKFYA